MPHPFGIVGKSSRVPMLLENPVLDPHDVQDNDRGAIWICEAAVPIT
jgi:hypothetical protein